MCSSDLIGSDRQAGGTPELGLAVVAEEPGQKTLYACRLAILKVDMDDLITGRIGPVRGTAQGHEGVVAVVFRKLVCIIEADIEHRSMGVKCEHRADGFGLAELLLFCPLRLGEAHPVRLAVAKAVGPAVMHSLLNLVQLFTGKIVAEVDIDLPRPRTKEMIGTTGFSENVRRIRDVMAEHWTG